MTTTDETNEPPLDPAMERVRRKMVRLLAVSVGIMLIGVMAVLAAVVYRAAEPADAASGASVPLALPAGARVVETALDGGRALLRIETTGGGELVVFDLASGAVLSRHPLVAE